MIRGYAWFVSVAAALAWTAVSCSRTGPTAPSGPVPTMSTLSYQKPADAVSGAESGSWTSGDATFSGQVRTNCVPNPAIAGSVCPDLQAWVRPNAGSLCQLWMFAPVGETLTARSYPRAERFPRPGVAGLSFNCRSACNTLQGKFTIHELVVDPAGSGTINRLHTTFEQACTGGNSGTVPQGLLTGELWIIDGTMSSPFLSTSSIQ